MLLVSICNRLIVTSTSRIHQFPSVELALADLRFRLHPFTNTLVLTSERSLSRWRRIAANGISDLE
jgi:hypothetical protein